ncbi:MAG: glycosyltransferase family 2 protein [Spirochaetes bacterium]|nr:glycosyltransferase family 2 protein [Spirochaetota bacterium]
MQNRLKIAVIIPALNEEEALPYVLKEIPDLVHRVIVVDNGSKDNTFKVAKKYGADAYHEWHRGYGAACLKGIKQLKDEEIILFLDADYSDYPDKIPLLVDPIFKGKADLVLSNRFNELLEKGALTPPQYFGNKLAVGLIRLFWGFSYKDLGPMRVITRDALDKLDMKDQNYGWTIEMQIKAIQKNLRIREIDVPYRNRIGTSKVSGTVKGVILAGWKILSLIFYFKVREIFGRS